MENAGTALSAGDIEHAERLAALEFSSKERAQILSTIGALIEGYRKRRSLTLPNDLAPAVLFRPASEQASRTGPLPSPPPSSSESGSSGKDSPDVQPSQTRAAVHSAGEGSKAGGEAAPVPRYELPFPETEEDIAFAPLANLAEWIRSGRLSSERLTSLYLDRLARIGPRLNCTVTITADRAMRSARRADEEHRAGIHRGPLHGIPWGAKDLFDTAGIPTSWGAEPFRGRVPETDAAVVRCLDEAGAVLVAKLSLGALAYGDIWYGGKTRNPWDPNEGSSGSSAGSAAATAAGLVGFSLGTETMGSIVSPSLRCGVTGLRPTFGRVPRTGAMSLSWSFDKIGPICRTVDDTLLVLSVIAGRDEGDPDSVDVPLTPVGSAAMKDLRVGYLPRWFEADEATDSDRAVLQELKGIGVRPVEIELPDLPYEQMMVLVYTEAAAAFEELTLSGEDDMLAWQEAEAWPNTFRMSRLIPAVEYVQAQRFRRVLMRLMDSLCDSVDVIVSPPHVEEMVYLTNATGHPSLTLRAGFDESGKPRGINLWGRLYDEGTLCAFGALLEQRMGVWDRRPTLAGSQEEA